MQIQIKEEESLGRNIMGQAEDKITDKIDPTTKANDRSERLKTQISIFPT